MLGFGVRNDSAFSAWSALPGLVNELLGSRQSARRRKLDLASHSPGPGTGFHSYLSAHFALILTLASPTLSKARHQSNLFPRNRSRKFLKPCTHKTFGLSPPSAEAIHNSEKSVQER